MARIGEPRKATLQRNCLICTKWITCRDPQKAGMYACSRFKPSEDDANALLMLLDQHNNPDAGRDIEAEIAAAQDEESISDIIEQVLTSGVPVPPDLKINDRHIIKPNNIFEWMTDARFLGQEQPPFAKQIQVAVTMLGEWCPECSDDEYFEDVPVDDSIDDVQERVVFLKKGVCPECGATKADLVAEEILMDPFEMVGIAGQRATKTATATIMEGYNTCRWLTTPNLPETFNVLSSTVLVSTYTATTYGQARENFWEPLNSILTDSPWFKEYHSFLSKKGYEFGEELFIHNDTILRYRHKNMLLSPAAPSKRVMRGRTRRSTLIDELGWFPVGQTKGGKDFERLDAKEVHKALNNSLRTLKSAYRKRLKAGYSNLPKPMMINISSPSSINDMIMTLHRQNQNSRETYCWKYKTWEFNPLLPETEFKEEFRTNPVEAARDYACEPPLGVNAWFPDSDALLPAFNGGKNGIKVMSTSIVSKSGKKLMSGNYKRLRTPKTNYSGVLAIDPGYTFNSFAFAIAYPISLPSKMEEDYDEDDEAVHNTKVRIFAVGEVIPKVDRPLSFNAIYRNILLPFCREFNIGAIIGDRWQNIKLMQDLEDEEGVPYFEHRLTKDQFDSYKEAIFDQNVILPAPELPLEEIIATTLDDYPQCFYLNPISHLVYQHLTVVSTGNTVIKGEATDDMFRTCVLAYTALQQEAILEEITAVYDEANPSMGVGAVALGASGRSSGYSSPGGSSVGMKFSAGTSSKQGGGSSLGIVGRKR